MRRPRRDRAHPHPLLGLPQAGVTRNGRITASTFPIRCSEFSSRKMESTSAAAGMIMTISVSENKPAAGERAEREPVAGGDGSDQHDRRRADRVQQGVGDPLAVQMVAEGVEVPPGVGDVTEVRAALESDMTRAAAQLMSDADLAELKALLDELHGQVHDAERYQETDTRYHDLIMRHSGNRLGRSIIRAIHPHARASGRYSPQADERDIWRAHSGHVAIYEQLLKRDARAARRRRCRSTSEAHRHFAGKARLFTRTLAIFPTNWRIPEDRHFPGRLDDFSMIDAPENCLRIDGIPGEPSD